MSDISDVREMRSEILHTNAQLRVMTHLARDGNVSLRDLMVLTRLFTGGSPDLAKLIANIQMTIALIQTARTVLKLLYLEMGPVGWGLLAAGTLAGLTVASQMEMRRPRY